jgi:hypothetical protein
MLGAIRWLLVLIGVLAVAAALHAGLADADTPVPTPTPIPTPSPSPPPECYDGRPRILTAEPVSSRAWSTTFLTGCNLGGGFPYCSATVGGVRAYLEGSCDNDDTRLVVPIAATSGPIVITVYGAASPPFPYDVLPLPDESDLNIVEGYIFVALAGADDIQDVISAGGPLAGELRPGPTPEPCQEFIVCFYVVLVEPGTEVEASIAYYSDPRVLYAGPAPIPCTCDPATQSPSPAPTSPSGTPTPAALPQAGGHPPQAHRPYLGFIVAFVTLVAFALSSWHIARRRMC